MHEIDLLKQIEKSALEDVQMCVYMCCTRKRLVVVLFVEDLIGYLSVRSLAWRNTSISYLKNGDLNVLK